MTISLSPKLEKLVHDKVASGQYESAEAVVAEALHLLQERDENHTPSDDAQAEVHEMVVAFDARNDDSLARCVSGGHPARRTT